MSIDPRFTKSTGLEIFTGNELLVKGALEAGVSLYSSYPGSPVAETLDVIRANAGLFLEHGHTHVFVGMVSTCCTLRR